MPDPDVAAPAQGRGLSRQPLWMEPEWGAPDPLVMFSGPVTGPATSVGPGAGVSLTACLLPLSQSPLSSPFAPGLGGPGGEGGELSGATTPCHQWTRLQEQPGMGPGSSRPESASPLCRPHQVFGGGDPKAILGRAPEEGPA